MVIKNKFKFKKVFLPIIISIFILITISIYNCNCNYSINNLPRGEYLCESTSPDNNYTIILYFCSGGIIGEDFYKGEIINNKTNKKRNIYYDYPIGTNIEWINEEEVNINGKTINIINGKYDFRVD